MRRTLLPLLAGTALGAAATYAMTVGYRAANIATPERPAPERGAASVALPRIVTDTTDDGAPATTAQRLALYRLAADADARTLPALLEEAAEIAPPSTRRVALDALLTRFAELDPEAAVESAQRLGVDAATLAPLYRTRVRDDVDAAMSALGAIEDRRVADEVGLALAEALGADGRMLSRLTAALPQVDAARFRARVVAAQAGSAPAEALQNALGLDDPSAVREALDAVAEKWAQSDPLGALEARDRFSDPRHRSGFEHAVLREWARSEPHAVLDYLVADPSAAGGLEIQPPLSDGSLIMELARADPIRLLDVANRLPPPMNQVAPQIALQVLSHQDPARAIAYAEAASGPMRRQYLNAVATSYGRRDADAALAWAAAVEPRDRNVRTAVIGGIAQVDPERALDLALAEPERMSRIRAAQAAVASLAGFASSADLGRIATRLLSDDGRQPTVPEVFDMFTSVWASKDPEAALEWFLANGDRVGPGTFEQVAQHLVMRDPARAASYTQRVPAAARANWNAMIASGYAQQSPEQATLWLEQIRGEPGYDMAATAVAQGVAQHDPVVAARVFESIEPANPQGALAASVIANEWARQDPTAAAGWASRLTGEARGHALRGVAMQWAMQDADTARNWALALPRGNERDVVLGALLGAAVVGVPEPGVREPIDPALIDAFTSSRAAERALFPRIVQRGQIDADEGRALLDAYITDPQLRQRAEQAMTAGVNRPGMLRSFSSAGPDGGFFVAPPLPR